MKKKILFLTSLNLTSNPRILKEMKLAVSKGFDVTFIGFKLGNWSDAVDVKTIENELQSVKIHYLSATRKPLIVWLVSSILEAVARYIWKLFPNNRFINALAHSKRTLLLMQKLKSMEVPDLIVAHNLPALYPAFRFAEKHTNPFVFDIEDFHPGEWIRNVNAKDERTRRENLMKRILPHCAFVTYASPLIGEFSLKLIENEKNIPSHCLINNTFSQAEFVPPKVDTNVNRRIRFVWFSQNINFGRGLELAIPALRKFKDKIELTLIGRLNDDFKNQYIDKNLDFIKIIPPLSQTELHKTLSEFDIGLAIDLSTADFNREIALTNKIFAYSLAGLYILFTDTKAQQRFANENINNGIVVKQTIEGIEAGIETICETFHQINSQKIERYENAKLMAWEVESERILNIFRQV